MKALMDAIRGLYPPLGGGRIGDKRAFCQTGARGGRLFPEEGKVCRYVAFIDKGLVRYLQTMRGKKATMYFNRENEFISYYPSFLSQTRRTMHTGPGADNMGDHLVRTCNISINGSGRAKIREAGH